MLDLSVVIVNYNAGTLLSQCIDSLLPERVREIVVVDNASSDNSLAALTERPDGTPGLRIIPSTVNLGFARASNMGATLCHSRYLLFLNPDTLVPPGSLAALLDVAAQYHDKAIIGPRLQYPDGRLQYSCGNPPSLWGNVCEALHLWRISRRLFGSYRLLSWDHSTTAPVTWVSGAALLVPRTIFDHVGGWDERFFMYAEDVDLCVRSWNAGYSVIYHPKVSIVHLEGQSSRKHRAETLLRGYRSKAYYFHKHSREKAGRAALVTYFLASILKAALATVLSILGLRRDAREVAIAHWSVVRNYRRLFAPL